MQIGALRHVAYCRRMRVAAAFLSRCANLPKPVNFIGLFIGYERTRECMLQERHTARAFAFSNSINALTIGGGTGTGRRASYRRIARSYTPGRSLSRVPITPAITLRSVRSAIRNEPARNKRGDSPPRPAPLSLTPFARIAIYFLPFSSFPLSIFLLFLPTLMTPRD